MTKTIYIYWEEEEYFTSFEDIREYCERNYDFQDFSEFLSEHYTSEEIFNFDESTREKIKDTYEEEHLEAIGDWINDYCTSIFVEINGTSQISIYEN